MADGAHARYRLALRYSKSLESSGVKESIVRSRLNANVSQAAPRDEAVRKDDMSKKAVFCIATNLLQAGSIVEQLEDAGFSNSDVSVLYPDDSGTRDFAHEHSTKAPEGATAGAGTGGVLGGALGWLVGAGALAIPGAGPFIAAGPILAALSGAAVGGAMGGVTGALVGMGIPEFEAKRYDGKVRAGNFLISVHTEGSDDRSRAKDIFNRAKADHISSTGESSAKGR